MSTRSDVTVEVDSILPTSTLQLPSNIGKIIKRAKLSLDDLSPPSHTNKKQRVSEIDPEQEFHRQLASVGGIHKIKSIYDGESVIDKLSYRILNDGNSILLTPLVISNSLKVKLTKLRIDLPAKVRSNCFSISEDTISESLVLDILTEVNVLITVTLKLNTFIEEVNEYESSISTIQNPNRFYEWCKYSLPYSFDVRPPLLMSSINTSIKDDVSLDLIIALKDGGLLKLARSNQDPLEDFIVTPFNDSSYLQNLKSRLFGINKTNNTTNNSENVSEQAVLSLTTFNDLLVTISLNKKLKIWSINSKNILLERDLNDFLPQVLWNTDLSLINSELLHLIATSESSLQLSVLLPLGETYFKILQLNVDSLQNESLTDVQMIETPVDTIVPNTNSNWICQSHKLYQDNNILKLWILWTFSNHKIIQQGSIDITSGLIDWIDFLNTENRVQEIISTNINEATRDIQSSEELNSFLINHIFDGVAYNDLIVETVAQLFSKQSKDSTQFDDSTLSLQKKVLRLNTETSDSIESLKSQWIKFDCTCKELLKISQTPLALDYDYNSKFLIIVDRYEYSILKQSSNLDLLANGNNTLPLSRQTLSLYGLENTASLSQLVELIQSFKKLFSNDALYEFEKALVNEYSSGSGKIEERMDLIFRNVIVPRINESTTGRLLEGLNSIPNILESIDMLISLPLATSEFNPIKTPYFGKFDQTVFISSYISELIITKEIILGLLLIILTVDINVQMVLVFNKLIKLLKFLNLNLLVSQIPLLELNNVQSLSDSLLINAISQIILQKGATIDNSNLNYLISYTFDLSTDDNFIYYILSKLISLDLNETASKLLPYLPETSISKVLEGIVNLNLKKFNDAFTIFNSNVDLVITEFSGLTKSQERSLEPISYLSDIFVSVSNSKSYETSKVLCYIELSGLFQEKGSNSKALEFILKSIEANNEVPIDDQVEFNKHYKNQLWKSFKLSLSVDNYDLAHDNILKMDEIDSPEGNLTDVREMIKFFILSLLNGDCIDKLLDYSFGKNCDEVDKRIYEIGEAGALNGELGTSLRYYRICYTWRYNKLGDYRGAAQALYRFNKIFELDKSKRINKDQNYEDLSLRIIENYIIILNALNILPDDDQWLIQHPIQLNNSEDGLSDDNDMDVSFDHLNKDGEYNKLVSAKDIDKEFKLAQRAQLIV